jgi:hypothetical protein
MIKHSLLLYFPRELLMRFSNVVTVKFSTHFFQLFFSSCEDDGGDPYWTSAEKGLSFLGSSGDTKHRNWSGYAN